jgi:D-proline reductase (dithiol) PrdB
MGSFDDFPWKTRLFLSAYPWRRLDPVPWTRLRVPLPEARVALCTSAGFAAPGQPPFDESVRGGDSSFRVISDSTPATALRSSHRSESFDHTGIEADPNLGLPLDRLHELVAQGRIGSAAPRHLSFMGSITAPGRLIRDSAPAAVNLLEQDRVDLALFVPV